jgi:hypothetical protein
VGSWSKHYFWRKKRDGHKDRGFGFGQKLYLHVSGMEVQSKVLTGFSLAIDEVFG